MSPWYNFFEENRTDSEDEPRQDRTTGLLSFRKGEKGNWDWGFDYRGNVSILGEARKQLVKSHINVSLGIRAGYTLSENSYGPANELHLFEYGVPLYLSWNYTKWLENYLVIHYLKYKASQIDIGNTIEQETAGLTLGLKLGQEWGALIEFSEFRTTNDLQSRTQTMRNGLVGIFIGQ